MQEIGIETKGVYPNKTDSLILIWKWWYAHNSLLANSGCLGKHHTNDYCCCSHFSISFNYLFGENDFSCHQYHKHNHHHHHHHWKLASVHRGTHDQLVDD